MGPPKSYVIVQRGPTSAEAAATFEGPRSFGKGPLGCGQGTNRGEGRVEKRAIGFVTRLHVNANAGGSAAAVGQLGNERLQLLFNPLPIAIGSGCFPSS